MSFEDDVVLFFKEKYKVDLQTQENITIDNMNFPNYMIKRILNIKNSQYTAFEYCRIINKIFGINYLTTKKSLYENDEVNITKKDIVFDLGANTGIFSLYASYRGAKVVAFEPSTLIRHYLYNTKSYNANKFNIAEYAISNKVGSTYLQQTDNPGASRLMNFNVPEYHKIICLEKCNIITLDKFYQKYRVIPSFIKMDIENSELEALLGAQEVLKLFHPKVAISIHEENIHKIKEIKSCFPEGYKFYLNEAENYDIVLLGRYYG